MAQQLTRAGAEVGLLALLETWTPEALTSAGVKTIPWLRAPLFFGKRTWQNVQWLRKMDTRERIRAIRRKVAMVAKMASGRQEASSAFRFDMARAIVEQANYTAMTKYEPKPFGGTILQILATDRPDMPEQDYRLVWTSLASHHKIKYLSGSSAGELLQEPLVYQVAESLNEALREQVQATASVA
jgi:thioesterase domain-containing protein